MDIDKGKRSCGTGPTVVTTLSCDQSCGSRTLE